MVIAALKWFWDLLPDLFGFSFTVAGLAVVLKPELLKVLEGDAKRTTRTFIAIWLAAFGVSALVSNIEQKHRSENAQATVQAGLKTSIDSLQIRLQDELLRHTAEAQYLHGRLDELSQFTPAILKLAQATEENTRKQYEAKMLSNKDLYDATMDVVKKMREFGKRRRADSARRSPGASYRSLQP